MKLAVGDRIILINSHEECGYREGDEVLIKRSAYIGEDMMGVNLTRSDCYGKDFVLIGKFAKYRSVNKEETLSVFSLFGKWLVTIKRI